MVKFKNTIVIFFYQTLLNKHTAIPRGIFGTDHTNFTLRFRQNWLNNKKDINKNIIQSSAKFVCSIPKKSRGMATLTLTTFFDSEERSKCI